MKKLIAALAASILAVGLAQGHPRPRRPRRHRSAPSYTPPPIVWGACTNPTLVRVRIAVRHRSSSPATTPIPTGPRSGSRSRGVMHKTSDATTQGVMLVNPGGPGGSGLIYSVLPELRRRNDCRPRPTTGSASTRAVSASSTPAMTCDPTFFAAATGRRTVPTTRPDPTVSGSPGRKAYAGDCATLERLRRCSEHVKTTDSVADMESLRKALGQKQDQLLRVLLRHLPRPGLRDPAPRPRAPVRLGRHRQPAAGVLQEQPGPGRRLPEDLRRSTSGGWRSTGRRLPRRATPSQQVRRTLPADDGQARPARRQAASSVVTS